MFLHSYLKSGGFRDAAGFALLSLIPVLRLYLTDLCGWLPCCKGFFSGRCSSAGAVMCTAFAVLVTAALMRSADRLPIILADTGSEVRGGFFRSGRALSITAYFTLANA